MVTGSTPHCGPFFGAKKTSQSFAHLQLEYPNGPPGWIRLNRRKGNGFQKNGGKTLPAYFFPLTARPWIHGIVGVNLIPADAVPLFCRTGRFQPVHGLLIVICLGVASVAQAADGMTIRWTNNMLTISNPELPGGSVDIWYLEAFCRSGSTHRPWNQTTIPHKTELMEADQKGKHLRLRTLVEPGIEVVHEIRAARDEVDFRLQLRNAGKQPVDVQWFQPCLRVAPFTGLTQSNYIQRCFIFTKDGLTTLDKSRRTEEALYRGGQVYVPAGIPLEDVNPRPISPDRPVNGLIGCVSADGQYLLATAWDQTQELFQGVIVCLHNDPRVGGLRTGETKRLRGKLYFLKNDPDALLKRYGRDFKRRG